MGVVINVINFTHHCNIPVHDGHHGVQVYRSLYGREGLRSQRTLLLTSSMQYVAILGMLVTLSPSAVRFECILHVHHEA